MNVSTTTLLAALDKYLDAASISDYCPNGLQVQGRPQIKRLVTGVTASQALIDAAIEQQADAILVHHGYFWKGENPCIVGMKHRRIKSLIQHDINLLAYHLPLDIHPEVGNNALLGKLLGLNVTGPLEANNPRSVGLIGELDTPMTSQEFAQLIEQKLARTPLVIDCEKPIRTVAWCTGGAQGYIEHAIAAGVDAFITGEISEHSTHSALENDLSYFSAGHHATERYGVQALGEWIAERFGIEHQFIDCPNPV
ncbi:Nif3-like dinuclear metal center hexameric protein [Thiopseudomonas acetoxidans]|uniref:Nif3-like dinuclear metal center hexameric protein n=1 Tax=Thiopseudomonas acetoxidans TaxID=3041622 RepID=A0ABT7SNI2_9GAMM|nr:Nif3-like dinuclear metal center hexameric protein [Thiopseudomonas sp. CY1220]MDM7857752.1 Nif3-like dinuclear metal center hexameric protein [Thiopseudomonas sp. CY1220]